MAEAITNDESPAARVHALSEIPDDLLGELSTAEMTPCVEDDLPLLGNYTD